MTVHHAGIDVEWLGYATLRFAGAETVVYTDPGRYGVLTGEWEPDTEGVGHPPARDYRPEDGDLVCLSHVHHYDPEAIERVAATDATLVAYEGIDDGVRDRDLPPLDELPVDVVRVGDKSYESVARHAGADAVIIPEVAGGERVLDQW